MPERAALDLTRIVAQYEPITAVKPDAPVLATEEDQDPLCFSVPVRLGKGPLTWSTSTALVPVERVCYDVNGYYRELGVHWRASRRELMQAYQVLDGQSSARLTFVFKQLLDPEVRDRYDRMPEGSTFLDDYTDHELKRRAHRAAGERSGRGEIVSAEEVLDEWGYLLVDDVELDSVRSIGKDQKRPDEPWDYSYYAWKTSSYLPDQHRLRRWQELLSTAASRRGVCPPVIIGTTALSDQPFKLEDVNGSMVIFFSEETTPTPSIADDVIDRSLHFSPYSPLFAESDIS